MKSRGEPQAMDAKREKAIRERHMGHPFDDACYVLAQLDIERTAYRLDVLALKAQVESLQRSLDKQRDPG